MAGGEVGAGVSVGIDVSKVAVGTGASVGVSVGVASIVVCVVVLVGDDLLMALPIAPQITKAPTMIPIISHGLRFFLGGCGGGA